jgi:hypothetical protein
MNTFTIILMANFVTLCVTVAAAIKRPIRSYILGAVIALCACISSLYRVVTGTGTFIAAFFTFALFAFLVVRIGLNIRDMKGRSHH